MTPSANPFSGGGWQLSEAAVRPWWREGVVYQIYVRSFADANGDGVGDLEGLIGRLDYLAWLGVDALWLNPITPSADRDWGYDVTDYRDVHPDLGDLETVDRLIKEAGARGIRVVLDLVPNHTSDRHPWFLDARSSRTAEHRSWYVWADPAPEGGPPNNWLSVFGGPAWTYDQDTGQFYLHNFLPEQPDLNWWNDGVRSEFDDILRFWLDRGVAGFRIDVAHGIVKDQALRDNLPVTEDDHPHMRRLGQRQIYSMHRPEVHDVLRRWRAVAGEYEPERALIGETWVFDLPELARYYGTGDELHLAFNFALVLSPFEADTLREMVEATEAALPGEAWPAWTGSNHDVGRFPTRWCRNDPRLARCALLLLLTLRGTPFLYYGDEIGMTDVELGREHLRDPVGVRHWPENPGRDPFRTPMQWADRPGGGFTRPDATPWLPAGDTATANVESQRLDPRSMLSLCRDLIALRRGRTDLRTGVYRTEPSPPGTWVWRRGERTVVALNPTARSVRMPVPPGRVLLATDRERDGEPVASTLLLHPHQAAVMEADPANA